VTDAPGLRDCFDLLIAIKPTDMPLPEAMRRTDELIGQAIAAHTAELRALR